MPIIRTRLTRSLTTVTLAAALTLGLAACDTVNEKIDEAQDTVGDARDSIDETVQAFRWCTAALRLGAAVASRDVSAARTAADTLQDEAPQDLKADVRRIVNAVATAEEEGTTDALKTQKVKDAGEAILTYSQARCTPGG